MTAEPADQLHAGEEHGGAVRLGVAVTIARYEIRRTIRATSYDVVQLTMIALFLLILLPFIGALIFWVYLFGQAIGAAESMNGLDLTAVFRGGHALGFLVTAGIAALRAASGRTELDQPPFLLASVPVPTVAAGQLIAECVRLTMWIAPLLLGISGALGLGAGTSLPAVTLVLSVLATAIAAYPLGFAVGFLVRHLATIVEPVARHRLAFGVLGFLGFLGVLLTVDLVRIGIWAFRTLQDSPLGWPGDIALVGLPGDPGSFLIAAGGVTVAVAIFPLGVAANTAIARRNWFTDPPQPEDDAARHDCDGLTRLESLFRSIARLPSATVATTLVLRARRKPLKLVYAAYPLLLGMGFVQQAVGQGYLPAVAVPWIALYGIWSAGVLVTLNPIGDLGDAAPSTILSGMSGHSFVRGHLLVAIPVGMLLAAGATTVAVLSAPVAMNRGLALIGLAAVGAVWAPLVALGVGSAAPRFSTVAVFRNATATLPSKRSFLFFTVILMLVASALAILVQPGLAQLIAWAIAGLVRLVLDLELTVEPAWVRQAAWATVVAGAFAPLLAYRFAVRAFERFGLS